MSKTISKKAIVDIIYDSNGIKEIGAGITLYIYVYKFINGKIERTDINMSKCFDLDNKEEVEKYNNYVTKLIVKKYTIIYNHVYSFQP